MKEARIIMPHAKDPWPHHQMEVALVAAFGGFTVQHKANGAWSDKGIIISDDVSIYDVAIEPNPDQDNALMRIALKAGRALNQKAVYIRFSNGMVKILDVNYDQKPDEPEVDAKRKPAVGEIWKCRDGSSAAVVATGFDVGNCILLSKGAAAHSIGSAFATTRNGDFLTIDMDRHPLDLVAFHGTF